MRITDDYLFLEALVRETRGILKGININREYNVPYLAGYSQDGKTIYIDKSFPKELSEFVALHEIVEKFLLDTLNISYKHAHRIALKLENYFVDLSSIMSHEEYEDICKKYIRKAEHEELVNVPQDLDLRPYQQSDDYETIQRIRMAQKKDM